MRALLLAVSCLCSSLFAASSSAPGNSNQKDLAALIVEAQTANATLMTLHSDLEQLHADNTRLEAVLTHIESNTNQTAWSAAVLTQLNTLAFMATACAFALGGVLGFTTWNMVLCAMREVDF